MTIENLDDLSRSTFDRTDCPCEVCKMNRMEPHKLRYAVVHNYSYAPTPWRPKAVADDPDNFFLGVELETDNYATGPGGGVTYSRLSNEMAADMRRPKNLWFSKRDGSVSGPEFVSHPATLAYWRKHTKALDEMFRMLVHAGFRSHDNDRCGMHVSISKTAFQNRGHLYRFLTLLHVSPAFSLKLSQRTANSASQWASLDHCATAADRRVICDGMVGGRRPAWYLSTPTPDINDETPIGLSGSTGNRYTALNAPYNQPRFEFRLPRGTLRIDRFFKNLEWVHAMVVYTRTATTVGCKPQAFAKWVEENRAMYPNLLAYMVEKKMYVRTTVDEPVAAPVRRRRTRRVATPVPAPVVTGIDLGTFTPDQTVRISVRRDGEAWRRLSEALDNLTISLATQP